MIRAAFFDVDGTLLNSRGEIPPGAVEALQRMRARGVRLFLATGRHKLELQQILRGYSLPFDAFVTLNGGYCYRNGGEVFYKNPIHRGDVAAAVEYLKGPGRELSVMFREEEFRYFSCISDRVRCTDPETLKQVSTAEVSRAAEHEIFQMCPYGTDEEAAGLLAVMPHSKATRWNDYGLDVVAKDGGKNVGIARTLERFGILPEEAAAFGDGENDEDMLRFAGVGVAMGNAPDRVKCAADYVARHVDEDGIAHAVRALGF